MNFKEYLKRHPRVAHYVYRLRIFSWRPSSVYIEGILDTFASRKEDVFFIQIGSNEGTSGDPLHNRIKKFEWRGILIEPLPEVYKRLRKNYASRKGLHFENAAIAKTPGKLDFYTLKETKDNKSSSQASSFIYEVIAKQRPYIKDFDRRLQVRKIKAMTLEQLFKKYKVTRLDLLHIDAEGFDYEIIKMFDFGRFKPAVIMFESEHLSKADYKQCLGLLRQNDYKVFFRDGHDTIALLDKHYL
jgi:FkbM family methyltransferase